MTLTTTATGRLSSMTDTDTTTDTRTRTATTTMDTPQDTPEAISRARRRDRTRLREATEERMEVRCRRRRRTTGRAHRLELRREVAAEVPVLRLEAEEDMAFRQEGEAMEVRLRAVRRLMHDLHRTLVPTVSRWAAAGPRLRTHRRALLDNVSSLQT